jgi:hypothetical protein
MRTGEIRRGINPGVFDQLGKIFVGTFQRKPMNARLERCDGVHFPAYFENEIVPPFDLFRCVRKREAEIA